MVNIVLLFFWANISLQRVFLSLKKKKREEKERGGTTEKKDYKTVYTSEGSAAQNSHLLIVIAKQEDFVMSMEISLDWTLNPKSKISDQLRHLQIMGEISSRDGLTLSFLFFQLFTFPWKAKYAFIIIFPFPVNYNLRKITDNDSSLVSRDAF